MQRRLQSCHNFTIQVLRAFNAVPWTGLVFQREDTGVVCCLAHAHIALYIRLAEAIPEFCVDCGARIGS